MAEKGAASELGRYLTIIREKRYLALAVGLAVLSAFVWGSYFWPKSYRADSTVFVKRGSLIQQYMKDSGAASSLEDELRILQNSITSRYILDRVIKKLDMDVRAKNPGQYEALINDVRKDLQVSVKGKGDNIDLFTISFEDGNPREARDFVNSLVGEYIEESMADRRNAALQAYTFLSDQLASYKKKLDEADQQISDFSRSHPDVQLQPAAASEPLSRLDALQSAEIDAQIKLQELTKKREDLAMTLSGKKKLTAGLSQKQGSLQARLEDLNNQLLVMTTKYTDKYPEVIKLKTEIKSVKKQIEMAENAPRQGGSKDSSLNPVYEQIKDELAMTDSSIDAMKTRLSEISRQKALANRMLNGLPAAQDELAKLERDRSDTQKIYDDLVQKLESAKVSKNFQMSDYSSALRVVDPAVLPIVPARPDRVRFILMGLFMGLVSGLGAAIGLDYMSNSYRDEETLEKGLRIPVLITIPHMVTESDKRNSLKRDRKIFGIAGVYVLFICVLLVRESLFRYMGIRIFPF